MSEKNDIVNRYTILFHDASPFMVKQLIQKLIKEIKRKYDDDVFAIRVMEYERGLRDAKPKVSKAFVEKWKRTFKQMDGCYTPSEILIEFSEALIKEAGLEVE